MTHSPLQRSHAAGARLHATRLRAVALAALAWTVSAHTQAAEYRLDPDHTRVHWEVSHFGTSTSRGRFDDIRGSLQFDAAQGRGAVSIVVGCASVNTGVAPLDGILRRSYLQCEAYPQAYFVASLSGLQPGRPFEARGELTLRGSSQPFTLRSTGLQCQPHPLLQREMCGADLEAELSRSDYGITDGLPFIGNQVRLKISVEALRD